MQRINPEVEYNCSPYTKSKGFTGFLYLAKNYRIVNDEDKGIFWKLLKEVDINQTNARGWTALMLATRNSSTTSTEEVIQMLLKAGANLNFQTENGWSALMHASRYSNEDSSEKAVQLLIDAGADLNLQKKNGWSALMLAARNSNEKSSEKTVQMLIDAGADINRKDLACMYGKSSESIYQKLYLCCRHKEQYTQTITKFTNQKSTNFTRKDIRSLETLLLIAKRRPSLSNIIKYKLLALLFC